MWSGVVLYSNFLFFFGILGKSWNEKESSHKKSYIDLFIYVFFKKKIVSKKCFSYVDELLFRLSLLNKGIVLVLISCATVNCFLIIVMGALSLSVSLSILHNYQLLQVLFTKTKKPSNLQRLHCVQVSPRAHRWLEMGKVLQEMKIENWKKKMKKMKKMNWAKELLLFFRILSVLGEFSLLTRCLCTLRWVRYSSRFSPSMSPLAVSSYPSVPLLYFLCAANFLKHYRARTSLFSLFSSILRPPSFSSFYTYQFPSFPPPPFVHNGC